MTQVVVEHYNWDWRVGAWSWIETEIVNPDAIEQIGSLQVRIGNIPYYVVTPEDEPVTDLQSRPVIHVTVLH